LPEVEGAVVEVGLLLDEGEAEAGTGRAGSGAAGEAFFRGVALVGWDAGAVVADGDPGGGGVVGEADVDGAVGPAVEGGVVEEVVHGEPLGDVGVAACGLGWGVPPYSKCAMPFRRRRSGHDGTGPF
jgi:hypothetical protein